MTAQQDAHVAATDLKQAVAEGRYEDMDRLLPNYTRLVAEARSLELAAQARDLIEWARRLILARRTTLATQLAALPVQLPGYRSPDRRPTSTWQFEG